MRSRFVLPVLFWGATYALMAQSPGTFTVTGSMTTSRVAPTATLLANGKVLIAGGQQLMNRQSLTLASAELYDPSTGTFTATGNMATERTQHTATLLPDGKVLIAGGFNGNNDNRGRLLASAELYDPSTGGFTPTLDMVATTRGHTSTLLNNGKVLIAGGILSGPCCSYLSRAELYDPSTGTFTVTDNMSTARAGHTATLLNNGKVLIESGDNNYILPAGHNDLDSAELYDPESGTFSVSGRSAYSYRSSTTASLLTNGEVLITLDNGCDPGDLAEVYDPSTGTFIATGKMTAPRYNSTATLLPDGTVLIAARGYVPNSGRGAELYDLATGTFSTTGSPVTEREAHAATILPDGTVLMTGGYVSVPVCCVYSLETAEIYHPAVLVPSPVLFALSEDGRGQGAILHSGTHQIVSSSNPAVPGETLEVYGTGLMDRSAIPPQVAIGGRMAQILYFGTAPGFVGLNQINVRVPGAVTAGPAVPVRLTYLNRPSNEVTIGVR